MIIKQIAKVPPTSDPYEDDCCGSHLGESAELVCDEDITIKVQQHDSGIGPDWRVQVFYRGQLMPGHLLTYVDDEGEFCLSLETK